MLIVTRLKLSNICQYDEIDIPIATGLMAVCGRNGSGKSTLLRGLMYGLTGLVDGSWGTQQNLQKDGVAVPGYVVVTIRDDRTGHEYIIKRYATSGAKFADSVTEYVDGNYKEVATRRKTVDTYLGDLYGIPVQLLFQLVWGRQGQLDLLLTAPAAYVSTFLSSVFDMKYLEVLRDKLKLSISSIAAYDDMTTGIAAAQKEKENLNAWIVEQQQKVDTIEQKLIPLREQHQQLQKQMNALSTDGLQRTAALQATKAALMEQVKPLDLIVGTKEYDKYRGMSLETVVGTIDNVNETIIQCHDTEGEKLASIDSEQQAVNKCRLELKDVEGKLVSLTDILNTVMDAKQKLSDSVFYEGTDTCILCGHSVDDKTAYVQQVLWLVGYEDVEAADIWDKPFNDRIMEVQQQINEAKRDIADINYAIKEGDKGIGLLQKKVEMLRKTAKEADDELVQLNTLKQWLQLNAKLVKVDQALEAADNNEAYETIKNAFEGVCNDIQTGEDYKRALDNEIIKARAQIASKDDYITKLQIIHEQAEINNSARGMLTLLRDVFSQQRAQARYLASKADELNARLASFLEMTGMPFNLYLDKDQRVFKYTSEGGFEHPTAHLSGAQKNISAVALQMALVEVISPNINLFLFDEPSESLDAENKIVMSELFKRMNRMLPSIGGTMLIVSRDEQLIEACENTININSKEESQEC